MLGLTRWNPFDEMLSLHHEMDRLFNQFGDRHLSAHTGNWSNIRVTAGAESWIAEVPLPGIDPRHITLEAAAHTIHTRAHQPGDAGGSGSVQFSQAFTVPPFLDVDHVTATHRHGMLVLALPVRESVRPRRIQLESAPAEQKRISAVA